MITYMLTALLFGLCCAVVVAAYVLVLGQDDTPLNFWFKWLNEWQEGGGWRSWITSPLGGCVMCCSGQVALWSSSMIMPWSLNPWPVAIHFIAASSAVLCAMIIKQMHRWLKNRI